MFLHLFMGSNGKLCYFIYPLLSEVKSLRLRWEDFFKKVNAVNWKMYCASLQVFCNKKKNAYLMLQ